MDTIYIQLLNEGTVVWRPTLGEPVEGGLHRVLATSDYDSATEQWEFPPGTVVRCVTEMKEGKYVLLANELVRASSEAPGSSASAAT